MAIHGHKSLDVFSAEGSSAEAAYVTKLRALSVSEKTNPATGCASAWQRYLVGVMYDRKGDQ